MKKWTGWIFTVLFILSVWGGQSFAVSEGAPSLALTQAEKNWLAQHPVIRLAPDPDFAPVEFFDRQGIYRGIAADFISLIEQRLGVRFERVQRQSWPQILEGIRAKKLDMLGAVAETPQRRNYLEFTEPFLQFPGVIIAHKTVTKTYTLDDLRGKTVALVEGYTGHELLSRDYPDIVLDLVPDTATGLRKVAFGRVDVFIGNLGTAAYALEREGITNLHVVGETGEIYRWAFAVRKDWPLFRDILQKALATIDDRQRQSLIRAWVQPLPQPPPIPRQIWLTMMALLAGIVVVVVWVIVWNRMLKQQVQQRTAQLQNALAEAESSRDNVDAILKSVADGLIVANRDNRVILMNRAAEQLLGLSLDKAYLQTIDTVLASPECSRYLSRVFDQGDDAGAVEWVVEGIGEQLGRTIQARTAVVDAQDGKRSRTITIVRDVTRERELDRMKNEFISTAAHELRTPLTAVMGYTELLLYPDEYNVLEAEDQHRLLTTIYEKACRLESIVSDLLDLSRVQSGCLVSLSRTSCDINRLLCRSVSGYQYRDDCDIALEQESEEVLVWADEKKIEQVMDNLLSNAVKFSPDHCQVLIRGYLHEGTYCIAVEDHGIGMTAEEIERIFDKFYRVDSSDTAPGGLGLGMSIVKNIVEAHGGTIEVKSTPGSGTCVTFSLPVEASTGASCGEG
nr:transporter substrate-binding domain-containing protein [uncultured Desulfuromonas sp.]